MTQEQFDASVREEICRAIRSYSNGVHTVFEWDKATGFSCDRINYGPYGVSSCSWIVPGTIEEEEPIEDQHYDDEEEAA